MQISFVGRDLALTPRQPVPWSAQERVQAYQRVFGEPGGTNGDTTPNREFEDLWLRFVSSVGQLGRQVRPQALNLPTGSDRSARMAALDLAAKLGSWVDSAGASRDLWQVVDQVSTLELGGAVNASRYRTMAESGGAALEWLASRGAGADMLGGIDDCLTQPVERWLAAAGTRDDDPQAISSTEVARRVATWSQALCRAVGMNDNAVERDARAPSAVVLFSGPAGTGKALAAHWLAGLQGRDVYRTDLSQVVSKYIGETEKNLDVVFMRAEQLGAVLVFDEADALFGRRTDVPEPHDPNVERELRSVLQRIERQDGMTILMAEAKEKINPGVLDRMRAVVPFPIPLS